MINLKGLVRLARSRKGIELVEVILIIAFVVVVLVVFARGFRSNLTVMVNKACQGIFHADCIGDTKSSGAAE